MALTPEERLQRRIEGLKKEKDRKEDDASRSRLQMRLIGRSMILGGSDWKDDEVDAMTVLLSEVNDRWRYARGEVRRLERQIAKLLGEEIEEEA